MMRFVLPAIAVVTAAPAAGQTETSAPPAPPPGCTASEHRQFDFWVGRWEVYPTGGDRLVAHSLIESLYGGCAIRENWMPLERTGGGSLNAWRPGEGRWRQLWTDSVGSWTEYVGGFEGGAMVLTADTRAPDGTRVLLRMRFTRESDGSVRQVGTRSTDGGAGWQPAYDFTYRRDASR